MIPSKVKVRVPRAFFSPDSANMRHLDRHFATISGMTPFLPVFKIYLNTIYRTLVAIVFPCK